MLRRAFIVTLLALVGCGSQPSTPPPLTKPAAAATELSEFDLLGVDPRQAVTEEEIAQTASNRQRISLKRGASILMIQAAAVAPEEVLLREGNQYFSITPFPANFERGGDSGSYSRALRLTAAKGGHDFLVYYWSVIERAITVRGSKVTTWQTLPANTDAERSQPLRMRLKIIVMDVKTGQWATVNPETLEDQSIKGGVFSKPTTPERVAVLKDRAYKHAVQELLRVVL